jgi:peroxiredoxin
MTTTTTFTTFTITKWGGDTTYKITNIKEHSAKFTAELGWSHFAEMKRLNGRRSYLANLMIVNGEVTNMNIVY